jgi:NAD-dependent DNA ligase
MGDVEVRGEVILLKDGLESINEYRIKNNLKPYENVRNAAAGILRSKTAIPEYCQYLRFVILKFIKKY